MTVKWQKYKPYLKYHRVATLAVLFLLLIITYNYSIPENTYDNGQIKCAGSKQNGLNEGHWVWYYPNGKRQMEGDFKEGKRKGIWIYYSEKGLPVQASEYDNDQLNGWQVSFGPGGDTLSKTLYKNDAAL